MPDVVSSSSCAYSSSHSFTLNARDHHDHLKICWTKEFVNTKKGEIPPETNIDYDKIHQCYLPPCDGSEDLQTHLYIMHLQSKHEYKLIKCLRPQEGHVCSLECLILPAHGFRYEQQAIAEASHPILNLPLPAVCLQELRSTTMRNTAAGRLQKRIEFAKAQAAPPPPLPSSAPSVPAMATVTAMDVAGDSAPMATVTAMDLTVDSVDSANTSTTSTLVNDDDDTPEIISLQAFCTQLNLPASLVTKLEAADFDPAEIDTYQNFTEDEWSDLDMDSDDVRVLLAAFSMFKSPPDDRLLALADELHIPLAIASKLGSDMVSDPAQYALALKDPSSSLWQQAGLTRAQSVTISRRLSWYMNKVETEKPFSDLLLPTHTLDAFCNANNLAKYSAGLTLMGYALDDVDGMAAVEKDVWASLGIAAGPRNVILKKHRAFLDSLSPV